MLGAWVALIPFVGPLFDYSVGSTAAWDWTAGRFWLNVLPGGATVLAGVMLLGSGRRMRLGTAAWIATIAGIWTVVGWQVSRIWNDGVPQSGAPYGGDHRQVLEMLGYSLASGALITAIGALALGRSTLATLDDERYDAEHRRREYEERLMTASLEGSAERPDGDDARDDGRRRPEVADEHRRHHLFGRRDDRDVDLRDRAAEQEGERAETERRRR
jgi:hypothetical protein